MSTSKIQKGDKVRVTSGPHKGTEGVVKKVLQITNSRTGKTNSWVHVTNIKKINKFRKAFTYNGQSYPGSQVEVDRKIHRSNVSLITEDGKLSKVKIALGENSKPIRIYKANNKPVVKVALPKDLELEKTNK